MICSTSGLSWPSQTSRAQDFLEELQVFSGCIFPRVASDLSAIHRSLGGGSLLVIPQIENEPRQPINIEWIEQVQLQHLRKFLNRRNLGSHNGSARRGSL